MTAQMTAAPDLSDGTRSFVDDGIAGHILDGANVGSCSGKTIEAADPSARPVVMGSARASQVQVDAAVGAARRLDGLLRHRRLRRGKTRRARADAHGWPMNSRPWNTRVSTVSPGLINTEMMSPPTYAVSRPGLEDPSHGDATEVGRTVQVRPPIGSNLVS